MIPVFIDSSAVEAIRSSYEECLLLPGLWKVVWGYFRRVPSWLSTRSCYAGAGRVSQAHACYQGEGLMVHADVGDGK